MLDLDTDEHYKLSVEHKDIERYGVVSKTIEVKIHAKTFFGARAGLETLSQLVTYDEANKVVVMPGAVTIEDKPTYPYRGLMIDTSRNFLPVEDIKRTLRAMSYNKLNTLHWHLSDTSSFSVETPSQPEVIQTGAYSPTAYYSTEDVKMLTDYATSLGIRLVPELDIPAHVHEGWTWGKEAGLGELVVCETGVSNGKWWGGYGLEPPTGQLNIANPNVGKVLANLYGDLIDAFGSPDLFHLGGDEVIIGAEGSWAQCWNETGNPVRQAVIDNLDGCCPGGLTDKHSFYNLWTKFTVDSTNSLMKAYGEKKPSKILQWAGNHLAEPVLYNFFMYQDKYVEACPPDVFMPMVWDETQNKDGSSISIVPELVKNGYDVILANSDRVYLDCGGPGWVRPGGYWCQPYHEWFGMYDYPASVQKLWNLTSDDMKKVKGAQTLMWAETADAYNFDSKVWPRTAGLAGSLWSHDGSDSFKSSDDGVDERFQIHRHRMAKRGIAAEALQPLWCTQNGLSCSIKGWPQQGAELNKPEDPEA